MHAIAAQISFACFVGMVNSAKAKGKSKDVCEVECRSADLDRRFFALYTAVGDSV